tara:strand:+ start:1300 stop:1608 length:309 start_codon:yes stop_codon:yes gene_type:complete
MIQYLIDVNVDVKTVIIPTILFYIIDLIVVHEGRGLLQSSFPLLSNILNTIYNLMNQIIFKDLHSHVMSHTLVFVILLIFIYNLVENFNFLYLKNKNKEILF